MTLAKLRQSRSVCGSLRRAYTQFLLYLTCRTKKNTKCTVVKKDDTCCGYSQWKGLPTGFEFTISMSMHMPMGFLFLSCKLNLNFFKKKFTFFRVIDCLKTFFYELSEKEYLNQFKNNSHILDFVMLVQKFS